MEAVYNRRNTNRLKWSGEKDKYWLVASEWTSPKWFQWDLELHKPILTAWSGAVPIFVSSGEKLSNYTDSLLNLATKENYRLGTGDFIGGQSPDAAGKFYRAIIWLWLYLKDSTAVGGTKITCEDGEKYYSAGELCKDTAPKEYRFCSRVEYEKDLKGKVELCGSITNYQE
jgi:hypothetical protein